jgi:hypothetical protein
MPRMTDPMDTLVKLQEAIDRRYPLMMQRCDIFKDLVLIADEPAPGCVRMTYARINDKRKVLALSVFAKADPIEGIPVFQAGNAVLQSERRQGLGESILSKGIEELTKGWKRAGITKFYIEGVVSVNNEASKKIASRVLSPSPVAITDEFCSEPALQYLKLIE